MEQPSLIYNQTKVDKFKFPDIKKSRSRMNMTAMTTFHSKEEEEEYVMWMEEKRLERQILKDEFVGFLTQIFQDPDYIEEHGQENLI